MRPLKWKKSYKVFFCLCRVTVCRSSKIKSPPITFAFVCSRITPPITHTPPPPPPKKVKKVDGSEAKFLEDEGSARQLAASRILKPCSFMMTDWRLARGRPQNLKPARWLASWDLKPTSEWCKWSLKCFHLFSANEGFWNEVWSRGSFAASVLDCIPFVCWFLYSEHLSVIFDSQMGLICLLHLTSWLKSRNPDQMWNFPLLTERNLSAFPIAMVCEILEAGFLNSWPVLCQSTCVSSIDQILFRHFKLVLKLNNSIKQSQ